MLVSGVSKILLTFWRSISIHVSFSSNQIQICLFLKVLRVDNQGKPRVLHRKMLLPVQDLPTVDTSTSEEDTNDDFSGESQNYVSSISNSDSESNIVSYKPPHRRKAIEACLFPVELQRTRPHWMTTGDVVLKLYSDRYI